MRGMEGHYIQIRGDATHCMPLHAIATAEYCQVLSLTVACGSVLHGTKQCTRKSVGVRRVDVVTKGASCTRTRNTGRYPLVRSWCQSRRYEAVVGGRNTREASCCFLPVCGFVDGLPVRTLPVSALHCFRKYFTSRVDYCNYSLGE
jgi:hypothetical protein